jgi:A118 family predicted phage portal protein
VKILETVKGWFSKMSAFKNVKTALKHKNIPSHGGYFKNIEEWEKIYKGGGDWMTVARGGINGGTRKINQFNAAKLVCNEFLNLTFSEQVDISISDENLHKYVNQVLQDGGFWHSFPELLERFYALGGAAIKAYLNKGKVKLDFVPATRFIPVSWDDVRITGGVFVSSITKSGKSYNLYEWHSFENGVEIIENYLYRIDTEPPVKCRLSELYPNLEERVEIKGLTAPTFIYFKPNEANNIDFDTPLGISVFANAIDTIKALDVVFDSFQREFILGKKRIIVPTSAIQTEFSIDGKARRWFDTSDEVYQAFRSDDSENLKIIDNTVNLRVDEHIKSINTLLDVLCAQVGLSTGTLAFDSAKGVRTATEVISQNSQTYRTVEGHQNLIREAIEGLIKSIVELSFSQGLISNKTYEINIHFDDSIITDKNADIENAIKLNAAGLLSKVDAMMKIHGYDMITAKTKLQEIVNEQRVGMGTLNLLDSMS